MGTRYIFNIRWKELALRSSGEAELETLRSELKKLDKQIIDSKKEAEDLRRDVASQENELMRATKACNDARKEKSETEATIASVQKMRDDTKTQVKEATKALDEMTKERDQLEYSLLRVQNEIEFMANMEVSDQSSQCLLQIISKQLFQNITYALLHSLNFKHPFFYWHPHRKKCARWCKRRKERWRICSRKRNRVRRAPYFFLHPKSK